MTSTAQGGRQRGAPTGLIGSIFLVVGAWFLWGPDALDIPEAKVEAIDAAALSTLPRRTAILSDPPKVNLDGFERTCMDCHRLFPPREDPPKQLLKHAHIVLKHGINERCRNCHDPSDRDKLVLPGGRIIGYADVVELCAKCHGPTYRDWQRGAHGRTNGYWDTSRGEMARLKCTQCHDPHRPRVPAMDPVRPMPGPNTLRMGGARYRFPSHDEPDEHRGRRNPLHNRSRSTSGQTHGKQATHDEGEAR